MSTNTTNIDARYGTVSDIGRDQINHIAGDQHNTYYITGPSENNPPCRPPLSFNDAPTGLLSAHFSGRNVELDGIKRALGVPCGSAPNRYAIYGMPGLGKTQLALRYAELSYLDFGSSVVFWMSGATAEKLNQGFAKILDLVDHPDRHLPSQSSRLTAAQRWLEESDGISWLLVLDNVNSDTVRFLREHLPRKNAQGNILITTRTGAVAEALVQVGKHVVELRAPGLKDATELFLKEVGGLMDEASTYCDAEDVVKCFGCLPLAISHAASFSKQSHTGLKDLLILYKGNNKYELISWENDLSDYQEKSVAATFATQLEELERRSQDVSGLLKVIAFFDPEAISVQMLVDGATELLRPQPSPTPLTSPSETTISPTAPPKESLLHRLKQKWRRQQKIQLKVPFDAVLDELDDALAMSRKVESLSTLICTPFRLRSAIQQLQSLSLVAYEPRSDGAVLRIHDLVQVTIRETTRREKSHYHWFDIAIELACGAFRDIPDHASPVYWPRCEMLAPHIQAMTAWECEYAFQNTRFVRTNIGMTVYLLSRGRFGDGEVLSLRAVAAMESLRGPDHPATLQAVHNVGTIYRFQGRYKESLPLLEKALAGREKQHGSQHVVTLTTMNGLAAIYIYQARYPEAEVLLKKALEGKDKLFGPAHAETLGIVNDLAIVNALQAHYDIAESLFRRALTGYEALSGPDSAECMRILDGLARVLRGQQRYAEAEESHVRALAGKEKLLGSTHPDTLRSMNNLSELISARGSYAEAEELSLRAMAGGEETLGFDHPTTLQAVKCLAAVYESQGRYSEAETFFRRALAGDENHLGTKHPETVYTLGLLTKLLQKQGRLEEADALKDWPISTQ